MDSPKWYARFWRRSAEWVAVWAGTLKFCGLHPVRRFVFARVKGSSESKRQKWLEQVYRRIRHGLPVSSNGRDGAVWTG
ncbi:hypothetical protein GCM10025857_35840 [Alicyclobacillus contaminans]|nr:hypothetical protein GCM10025857_35840 [Alicyclobacillus contaminans]